MKPLPDVCGIFNVVVFEINHTQNCSSADFIWNPYSMHVYMISLWIFKVLHAFSVGFQLILGRKFAAFTCKSWTISVEISTFFLLLLFKYKCCIWVEIYQAWVSLAEHFDGHWHQLIKFQDENAFQCTKSIPKHQSLSSLFLPSLFVVVAVVVVNEDNIVSHLKYTTNFTKFSVRT